MDSHLGLGCTPAYLAACAVLCAWRVALRKALPLPPPQLLTTPQTVLHIEAVEDDDVELGQALGFPIPALEPGVRQLQAKLEIYAATGQAVPESPTSAEALAAVEEALEEGTS